MKFFTRIFLGEGAVKFYLTRVKSMYVSYRLSMDYSKKASVLFLLLIFTCLITNGQTTFSWRNDQNPVSGQWNVTNYWWNGSASALPGGAERLFLDGAIGAIMTNDLPSTNRYRIEFGTTAATSKIINGIATNTFFDFGGNVPGLINNSGVTHTINFPFLNGNSNGANRLEINAISGNFIIGSTIGPSGGTPRALVGMGGGAISFNGVISGAMNFVKEGGGVTTFTASNIYSGTTSVTAGTLSLSGSGTYGINSRVNISNGATLNLNDVNTSVQSVEESGSGNGGVVTVGSGTLTVLGGFAGTRFQNSIVGTGSLIKQGTGTMSLYGSQSYTGTTTITGGELSSGVAMSSTIYSINGGLFRLAAPNILPDAANVTMSSGTFAVDNNETINNLNISAGGTLTVGSGVTLTINGTITGGLGNITNNGTIVFASGATVTTFPGSGTVTINNLTINNLSGASLSNGIVISGTLAIGNNNTFSLNGNAASAASVTAGNSSSTINNGHLSTAATFTFNNSTNYSFGGTLTNGSTGVLNVTKSGLGNLTLSGGSYLYSGTTTISAGTLTATALASLPDNGNISMGNATLVLGAGFTGAKALGTLQITGTTSYLNVGSASALDLTFQNSSGVAWTGTFNVLNWTPTALKNIYFLSTGLTSTASTGQLDNFNFDTYGMGSKFDASTANKVIPKFLYITKQSGSFSDINTWQNLDKPNTNAGNESIYIRPSDILTQDINNYPFLSINVGGTYNIGANTINLTGSPSLGFITNTGTINMLVTSVINMGVGCAFNNSGIIASVVGSAINFNSTGGTLSQTGTPTYSGAGTINFLGAGTISGTATLGNISIAGLVNFGTGSTIGAGSSLSINAGGAVSSAATAPFYAAGSRLVYRRGLGITYNRFNEWCALSGRGFPDSVLVTNNTILNLNAGATGVRKMGGSLTIDAGSEVTMVGMTDSLSVADNVIVNGTLRLGSSIGSDLRLGGDYYQGPSPAYTFNNDRAVWFINPFKDQFVTKLGGGNFDFDFIVVDKSATTQLKMTAGTNAYIQTDNTSSLLRILQLLNGNIDMNGGILTVEGNAPNSMNIAVGGLGTRKIYTNTGSGEFRIRGSNAPGVAKLNIVDLSGNSKLLFDNDVLVSTTVGCDFGARGITTINAILRIDQYGYIINNSPNYGTSSTLIYNNGSGGYKRNTEWNATSFGTLGTGFPNNIMVQNNTPLQLNSTDFPTAPALGCSGNFTINTGSSVITTDMANPLSVGGDLTIAGALTLSINTAGVLNVGGNWTRTGTFVQNDRMVTFNGTNPGTITATGGQSFTRMTIDKSTNLNTIAVTDPITITNELFLQRGAVTLNNEVIIKSDAIQTARIGQTSNPLNISLAYNGSGKFVIQRYLPMDASSAARRWRLLTAPIKIINAPTINAAWQEGVVSADRFTPSLTNPNPGFGTHITRTTVAKGYDQGSTTFSSIYNHVAGAWAPLDNTNLTAITSSPGYMLFVRGDRSFLIAGTNVAASPTTLRVKGEINIGTVTVPLNGSTHQVIGNPYASAISFNSVSFNGINPGTTSGSIYYLWDPKLSGNKNVGGFVTFTSLGTGLYSVTANSSNYSNTGIIESGAAFMVQGTGVGNFIFNESCKLASNSTVGIASRPMGGDDPLRKMDFFTSNLFSGTNIAAKLLDGVNVVGSADFDNEVNENDALKLAGFSSAEMLSLKRSGKKISIELRKKITHNDTLFYEMGTLPKGAYQFELIGKNIDPAVTGILVDSYAGKQEILNTNDTNRVVFDVVENALSASADRFMVVFKSSAKFNSINAYLKEQDVSVEWVLGSEINISRHEIQRSSDGGNSFVTIGDLPGGSNNFSTVKYSFKDVHPAPGNYLYRVKSVTGKGVEILSENAAIKIINCKPGTFISPNPITSNTIIIQMNKMPAAIYGIRLLNDAGQVIQTSTINHPGTSTQHSISIAQSTAKGTYQLELSAKGKKTILLPVLIQ